MADVSLEAHCLFEVASRASRVATVFFLLFFWVLHPAPRQVRYLRALFQIVVVSPHYVANVGL